MTRLLNYIMEGLLRSLIHLSRIAVENPEDYETRSNIMWIATWALNTLVIVGADLKDLFQEFSIWEDKEYQELQGAYPVISPSLARVKEINYAAARDKICEILRKLYVKYYFIRKSDVLTEADRDYFDRMLAVTISDSGLTSALYQLSGFSVPVSW